MRPTELGWKALLLFAALEVAFFATSYSNLFFLVIAFSCVLGLAGLVAGWRNLCRVDVAVLAAPLAAATAERLLPLRLHAGRRVFDLEFDLELDGRNVRVAHVPMLTGQAPVQAVVPGLPRGLHAVRAVHVTSCFPFGLLRMRRRIVVDAVLATHPTPSRGAARAGGDAAEQDGVGSARSSTIAGLRAHRRGDEPRDVHWKATARRGAPVVREWEPEGGQELEIVLDRRCDADVLERALSEVAAAVFEASGSGRALTVLSQGATLRAFGAGAERDAVLRWLAGAQPVAEGAPPPASGRGRTLTLPGTRQVAHA